MIRGCFVNYSVVVAVVAVHRLALDASRRGGVTLYPAPQARTI